MIFEEFLKDTRKSLGVTQNELAERAGTTYQNISSYERVRTNCSFDVGMSLLNALGVSVLLENNQIILLKGDTKMKNNINNKKYERQDLDFINFNPQECYSLNKERIEKEENDNTKDIGEAYDKLKEKGYNVYFSRFFMDRLWDADHYPSREQLVNISKGDREIALVVSGGVNIDFFLFEDFISDIKEQYPQEGAFIEKVLMFECLNNDKGKDIYHAFKYSHNALSASALLDGYEELITKFLEEGDYFFKLQEEYDPRELTISDMLGIYDCYSSSYPYYAFKMPDGEIVLSEESFEGHYIGEALKYAINYFEDDYDRYLEMYEDEDARDELVLL